MDKVLGLTGVCGRVTYFVWIVWRESMSPRFDCNWLVTVTPLASGDNGIDDLFFSFGCIPLDPEVVEFGTFRRGRAMGAGKA